VRRFPVLLVCDHASSLVPAALNNLGLSADDLSRHIAIDLGAAALTRALASRLAVPAVLSGYSRLVVDCNRHLHDPSAFAEVSDGTVVPGNLNLSAEARRGRADALYWPYHGAIQRALDVLGGRPALIALHSFTPDMGNVARPWHIGVLWDQDARLAEPLLRALRANDHLCVGDNEPYSGRHPSGYTIDAHAEARGLAHVSIEIRQDLLATSAGVDRWAALLAAALHPILAACFSPAGPPGSRVADDTR
jgi:predicted N-formylglutamate amidohydrolase